MLMENVQYQPSLMSKHCMLTKAVMVYQPKHLVPSLLGVSLLSLKLNFANTCFHHDLNLSNVDIQEQYILYSSLHTLSHTTTSRIENVFICILYQSHSIAFQERLLHIHSPFIHTSLLLSAN